MNSIENLIKWIKGKVDEKSNIILVGNTLIMEIYLPTTNKFEMSKRINTHLRMLDRHGLQIILSVMNDMDDCYARIITQNLDGTHIECDQLDKA